MKSLRSGSHLNALVKWVNIVKRKQELMTEGGEITETDILKLLSNLEEGRWMNVNHFSDIGFQIVNPKTSTTRTVALDNHQCTCGVHVVYMW
jgi:hypothetical protein